MQNVVYYPDPFIENKTFGDPKGHFSWGSKYYTLMKTVFPSSASPHFYEGDEYEAMGLTICARRGVDVSLSRDG